MNAIVVVDRHEDWPIEIEGLTVVTGREYLTEEGWMRRRRLRVYNLCRSFAYQSSGYYVSLLAAARDHRPLPDVATIQDLKLAESPRVVNDELDELADQTLAGVEAHRHDLHVYFGIGVEPEHRRLARELYNLFPAPLLQARFARRRGAWRVTSLNAIALGDVPQSDREALFEAARAHFAGRPARRRRKAAPRYELAILNDPTEVEAPSDPGALKRFRRAGESIGLAVDLIERADYGQVAEYDALFIRETTAVNHHTYRFARRAEREGLVVIDDPGSILRCTNKVFLAQLMARHGIPTPRTLVVHRGNVKEAGRLLGFPCVLKQPDSSFSRGVIRADDEKGFRHSTREMLEHSDLVIAQAFEPTDFDWRIGVIGGSPLYACRYMMAPGHWQVVQRTGASRTWGGHETLAVEDVPEPVLDVALRAARAIGDGLYGVDLKQVGDACRVIEVNDNPSIDRHVEDQVLGDTLYLRIMEHFLARLEARGRR